MVRLELSFIRFKLWLRVIQNIALIDDKDSLISCLLQYQE